MRLPEKEQTRLYESYWSRIEGLFRGSERTFDAFVRDYLALRMQPSKQEKADSIYFVFRREFAEVGGDATQLEEMLRELLRFARYHAAFSIGVGASRQLREPLARLRRLVDVPAILIMRLYDCYDSHGTLIHRVKQQRQIILITHNPNIPVLGEASAVYVLTSDGERSRLANCGCVDTCKSEIINLLEGGKEAFVRRKERYDY